MEEGPDHPEVKKSILLERTFHDLSLSSDRRLNEMADVLYDEYERNAPEDLTPATEIIGNVEYSVAYDEDSIPRLLRRPLGSDGEFELVLDLQQHVGECGGRVPEVRAMKVSPDHAHVAFTSDMGQGGERYVAVIHPLGAHVAASAHDRVGTRDPRVEHVAGVGSLEWVGDGTRVVYVATDKLGRPFQVRCHRLGTPSSSDTVLFTETNERRHIQLTKTRDGRLILINSNSKLSSEVLLIDAHEKGPLRPHLLQRGRGGLEYFVEHHRGSLCILSNLHAPGGDYALYSFPLPPSVFPPEGSTTAAAATAGPVEGEPAKGETPNDASPSTMSTSTPMPSAAAPNFHDGERRQLSDKAVLMGLFEARAAGRQGANTAAEEGPGSSPEEERRAAAQSGSSSLREGQTQHLWRQVVGPRKGVHVVDMELLGDGTAVLVESCALRPQVSLLKVPPAPTEPDTEPDTKPDTFTNEPSHTQSADPTPPPQLKTVQLPPWACHLEVTPISHPVPPPSAQSEPPTSPADTPFHTRLECTVESPFLPPQALTILPPSSASDIGAVHTKFDPDTVQSYLDRYHHRVEWVSSSLGPSPAKVPLSLFYKKPARGTVPGPSKVLLEAYGAYGLPLRLTYSPTNLSLLDRGFVLAYAHVRGGGELGRSWHAQGRLTQRANSVADFLSCIDYIASTGIAPPSGGIALRGHSAGGILLGNAILKRLPLIGAVIAHRPFFDVLTCMTDPSLDLTVQDYEEFGHPLNPQELEALRALCPYHNLRPGSLTLPAGALPSLPPMRITTSIADRRVPFWGTLKFVARLRHAAQMGGLGSEGVFLDFGEGDGGGHYGNRAAGPLEELKDAAFLIKALGG